MSENKVTQETIDALVSRVEIRAAQVNPTVVLAMGFLDGKFYLGSEIGACVDPTNFDEEQGRKIAMDKLIRTVTSKFWELEGYRLYRSLEQLEPAQEADEQAEEDPA